MWKAVLALLVLSDAASGLQIGVASRGVRLASAPQRRTTGPQAQFGGQDKGSKGLSRDEEPEEFFATNMDKMSDEEKLKSPGVVIGLGVLIAPFIAGVIALQFAQ